MLGRLGDDRIATMGADEGDLGDFRAAWRRKLGPCRAAGDDSSDAAGGAAGSTAPAAWCSPIPVLAFVVSVRDAAAPGEQGLLRPLLRRWQAGGLRRGHVSAARRRSCD